MDAPPLSVTSPVCGALRRAAENFRVIIPAIADETVSAVEAAIPEYARSADETYRRTLQAGVEQALTGFLHILERRDDDSWRDVYRSIGAGEMREDRSLDALQQAIRIGARISMRHLFVFAESESLSATDLGSLADAVWSHIDDLAEEAAKGYAEARAAECGDPDSRRRRLFDLLMADPPVGDEALSAAAAAADWPLPRRLAAVALDAREVRAAPPILAPGLLADLDRAEPALIVPDPESLAQVRLLADSLHRYHAAVGPVVRPTAAADSLRWARQALSLAGRGIIGGAGPIRCENHLATLAIFQDEVLLASVVERRLRPLTEVRPSQRDQLADTLLSWLQNNMNANAVGASLHLHPQTVRRRLRQLDRLFGDQVHDSRLRFELEIALRADHAHRAERRTLAAVPAAA
jgi:hypothetical protein